MDNIFIVERKIGYLKYQHVLTHNLVHIYE